MFKRVFAFLLIFSLLMSLTAYPAAADSLTANQKAVHLNKMSIITDYNTIFNLDKQLTRAEAVIYAARLMGAENYITANAQQLRKTTFSDVYEYMDYAPYVGYCTSQGLISGVGNGMFDPDGITTEKAFLVILFGVLGYKSGTDFTWGNIFTSAFSIGLVKDISYISRTSDNINFTREDAVNIMFNALTCKIKGTDTTLAERLVEINAIDINDAVDAGLIDKSAIAVKIDNVTPLSSNRIMIKFNCDVKELEDNNIEIYETNSNTPLTSSILSQSNDMLVVETSTQKVSEDYTLVIRGIISSEGNITDKITSAFKGYGENLIDSDFFRISMVEALGSNVINVYFTHPININAEFPYYYSILKDGNVVVSGDFQNMTVKCLNTGNGVSIYLKNDILVPGTKYTLKVDGNLVSRYGTFLNEKMVDSTDFYAISGSVSDTSSTSSDELTVTKITALDDDTIEVRFSKEIDSYFAKQNLNYMVYTPKNTPLSIDQISVADYGEYKNRVVLLKLKNSLEGTGKYDLYINFLPDTSKSAFISDKRFTFTGTYPKSTQLKISKVEAINSRVVSAIVDKPLVSSYAEIPTYYTIMNKAGSVLCNPIEVIYTPLDTSKGRILMLLPKNITLSDKEYKLSISNALPYYISSISEENATKNFSGNKTIYDVPRINDAVIVGNSAIKVTFTGEIAASYPNLSVDNYKLEYTEGSRTIYKIPIGVIFIDSKTVILLFDNLNLDKAYTLRWDNASDVFGNSGIEASGNGGAITVRLGKK